MQKKQLKNRATSVISTLFIPMRSSSPARERNGDRDRNRGRSGERSDRDRRPGKRVVVRKRD
ncbi:MAG: hypothetical protein FWD14_08675 [Treponema sp.]|nr:hypothetical protein [Treponema sp.]